MAKSGYIESKLSLGARLGSNPLVGDDFVIRISKIAHKGGFKKDGEDWLPLDYDLERDKKVFVYTHRSLRESISALSGLAKGLFLWLLYEVEYGRDYIDLKKDRYMFENGLKSEWSYRKGRNELIRYKIICPTVVRGVYWINPAYFFAGSRSKKYPSRVRMDVVRKKEL